MIVITGKPYESGRWKITQRPVCGRSWALTIVAGTTILEKLAAR